MLRPLTLHDLKSLEESAKFPIPNINSPICFYQKAIEDEKGNLIGLVLVRLTTETSAIFHENLSKQKRTKALLELWQDVEKAHIENGLEDTHIVLDDDYDGSFDRILQKLGFVEVREKSLYYRVGTRRGRVWETLIKAGQRVKHLI